MKVPNIIKISIFFITIFTFFGCAPTFKKGEYVSHVVNEYGINASNVKNIYGVHYTVTSNTSFKGVWKMDGVLVATNTALILYADTPDNKKPVLVLNLPYKEIKKVACVKAGGRINQIHVFGDLGVFALSAISESGFVDATESHQLCEYIKGKKVPAVDVKKLILFPI